MLRPVLGAIVDKIANEGIQLTFKATASDPDAGQSLSFSLDSGAPLGATINPTNGLFAWTPSEAQGPSTNTVTVRVTDNGSPAMSAAETFSIVVTELNSAPSL